MSNLINSSILRKAVPGYEGLYCVTSDGKIISCAKEWIGGRGGKYSKPETELKQKSSRGGYLKVDLKKDGIASAFTIHRIIALAFIPNPENKPFVNHKNGIKTDNRVENLEWCTRVENSIHAYKTGLMKPTIGEVNGNAKLNDNKVNQILSSSLNGPELSRKFGVSVQMISYIRTKKNWRHVPR